VAGEHREQQRGAGGEREHAVAEGEAIAEPQEDPWRVAVASHEREHSRETIERSVCRK